MENSKKGRAEFRADVAVEERIETGVEVRHGFDEVGQEMVGHRTIESEVGAQDEVSCPADDEGGDEEHHVLGHL